MSCALLLEGMIRPLLEVNSSSGSSFIVPRRPCVWLCKTWGSRTVRVMTPSSALTSTPVPNGNITVTLVGLGEKTKTSGATEKKQTTETVK